MFILLDLSVKNTQFINNIKDLFYCIITIYVLF